MTDLLLPQTSAPVTGPVRAGDVFPEVLAELAAAAQLADDTREEPQMNTGATALFGMPDAPARESMREHDVLNLLVKRYSKDPGNGPRYAVAKHVRSHAGFDARRTADFIAMDLWPSKGLELHGHEVKVSRSDWLTELKQPEKAAEFIPFMNRWWLVVSDRAIVRAGELPDGWGLMAPRGGQLAVVKPAQKLDAAPMPRTMLAALLRAAVKTATPDHR